MRRGSSNHALSACAEEVLARGGEGRDWYMSIWPLLPGGGLVALIAILVLPQLFEIVHCSGKSKNKIASWIKIGKKTEESQLDLASV